MLDSTKTKHAIAAIQLALAFSMLPFAAASETWVSLFNGRDLSGWIPKIRGCPLSENFQNTFRVQDGVISVNYSNYQQWDKRYGHLFYKTKVSHYRLRFEYHFSAHQLNGGADWALRNSGVMIHSEPPETMELEQEFPVSLEVQLLGGNGKDPRHTANLCTPGTSVSFSGKTSATHCIDSSSKTFTDDQWVRVEIEVNGHDSIRHFVNGELVMSYREPKLTNESHSAALAKINGSSNLSEGYLCLQSESHPVEFRKIEILVTRP